jgi:PBS lyase HEAT-like repeat
LFLDTYIPVSFRNKKCHKLLCPALRQAQAAEEPFMKDKRRSVLVLLLGLGLLVLNAFGAWNSASPGKVTPSNAITRHISILKSGRAQDKAAAAYWLGQQHVAAASAVYPLVDLLGDTSQVDPLRYRSNPFPGKMTLGEEAAAALVNIGHPSIDALIRVLRNSPLAEARKNAAWALGALHDTGATTQI